MTNTPGQSNEHVSMALARRVVMQPLEYSSRAKPADLAAQHKPAAIELGKGFPQTRQDFSQALRAQQASVAQDILELWDTPDAHVAAEQFRVKSGVSAGNFQTDRPH